MPAVTHRTVFAIAGPIVFSNVTTPLLGVIDTAVIGQLGDPKYIGGVALGALIFTFAYWGFGFLRMGTTGLTAQAHGAQDAGELRAALGRALLVGGGIGIALILLQGPLRAAAFWLLDGTAEVEDLARGYFDIRIWSAPAAMANFALLGWFIGRERAGIALVLQLFLNSLNLVLDVVFVLVLHWEVAGIAAGTLIAEYAAMLLGLLLAMRDLGRIGGRWERGRLLDPAQLARTLSVNRDIFIRSLALIAAFFWFTAQSAKAGTVILAVNAILLQFVSVSAYFLDGFAFAAEALVGKALGQRHRRSLLEAIRLSTLWAALTALLMSAGLIVAGGWLIDFLSVDPTVRADARVYLPWAAAMPILSVWCYQLDGIFIGATRGPEMRNASLASTALFLGLWALFTPYGNHGLWLAFALFNLTRAATLGAYLPRVLRAAP